HHLPARVGPSALVGVRADGGHRRTPQFGRDVRRPPGSWTPDAIRKPGRKRVIDLKLPALVAAGAVLVLLQGTPNAAPGVPDDHQPDVEMRLECAGKSAVVRVGERFKIEAGGRSIDAV